MACRTKEVWVDTEGELLNWCVLDRVTKIAKLLQVNSVEYFDLGSLSRACGQEPAILI